MSTSPFWSQFSSPFLCAGIPGLGFPRFDPILGFLNRGNYFWRTWHWWGPGYGGPLDCLLLRELGREQDYIQGSPESHGRNVQGNRRGQPKKRPAPKVHLEIDPQTLGDKSVRSLIDDLLVPTIASAIIQQLTEGVPEERE